MRTESTTVTLSFQRCALLLAGILATSNGQMNFLYSGQSNSVGHTTSGQSIERNASLFLDCMTILEDTNLNDMAKETSLSNRINIPNNNAVVANSEARELLQLYNDGLMDDLLVDSLTSWKCSFIEPQDNGSTNNVRLPSTNVIWDANCGRSFGHELMFARTLEIEKGYDTEAFSVVKVARGGTEIHKHWSPSAGLLWPNLVKTIQTTSGEWAGFVWHQGTQEAWTAEDTSLTYLSNLTCLVDRVRQEMFAVNSPGVFGCRHEIPVVIVQIGFWPQTARAANVRAAQQQFCDEDPRAIMVQVYDLSRNYHFDAPSMLIAGRRIADAYENLMNIPYTCPGCGGAACRKDGQCCSGFVCTGGSMPNKFCEEAISDACAVSSGGGGGTGGGGGGCYPSQAECSDNLECCSGSCKGGVCRGN